MNRQIHRNIIYGYVVYGWDIILGCGNDDEEADDIRLLEKVDNFAEEIVPRFSNNQFKQHFRMCPDTFENFLSKLHVVCDHEVRKGHPEMKLEKQAMITIWYLANIESFRSVGDRFGISKSTCWDVLQRICKKILLLNQTFKIIWWPCRERALNTIETFQRINGFPGVIGCIDGSHVKILPPQNHPNSYFNRKKFHSVLIQGVCDHEKLFIDIYAGEPGSIHDSRLLEKSDLQEAINQGLLDFPDNSHLLGDLAYKLNNNLLVGFKNNGMLNERQVNFNNKLSQIRITIENAFSLLKGRFRRLKFIETIRLDLICILIVSACVLHNICILNGDDPNNIMDVEAEVEEERRLNRGMNDDNAQIRGNQQAIVKRNRIVNLLR